MEVVALPIKTLGVKFEKEMSAKLNKVKGGVKLIKNEEENRTVVAEMILFDRERCINES